MKWNDGLTGQALAIAASTEKRIRITAGPGSGKTFSLMRKIARLIESGVDPTSILLVTFTKTAANDLKKELLNLGIGGVEQVDAGTLHSFCFKILRKANVFESTSRIANPILNFELEPILNDLQRINSIGKKEVKSKIKAYEAAWAKLQAEVPGRAKTQEEVNFENTLVSYLKFHKAMLIGEVIPIALSYLKSNPLCEERSRYKYVFVDEYQDLNKAEQELINIISEKADLMVIGDEDQSIFEKFRYAHPEGIREFKDIHVGTVDYPLVVCRRCPIDVVKIADNLINTNRFRQVRHLQPMTGNPSGLIHAVQWHDLAEETEGLSLFIKMRISEGVSPGQILLMTPRRDFGNALRNRLMELGIEAHCFFAEELFQDENAQKSMTLINLLIDRNDRKALRCWLGFESESRNSSGYISLVNYCTNNDIEPYDALELLISGEIKLAYTTKIIERFKQLKELIEKLKDKDTFEIIDELFPQETEWANPFVEMTPPKELLPDYTLTEFRKDVYLSVTNPEMPQSVSYIRIMSIHKSKGLTAELCIICGVIHGLIPRISVDGTENDKQKHLEEQRRLFYVGLTRAKSELVISNSYLIPKTLAYALHLFVPSTPSSETRSTYSRFINELGEEFPTWEAGAEWLKKLESGIVHDINTSTSL